jgi:hypothetical protein
MNTSFDPISLVIAKECVLLLVAWGAGLGFLGRSDPLEGVPRSTAVFAALPLGIAVLLVVGTLSLRVALVAGLPRPFHTSLCCVAAAAVSGVLRAVWQRRRQTERWAVPEAFGPAVLALFALALTPFLPMLLEPDIVFYAGHGTDASGYARAADAIIDGYYFDPAPTISMDDVLLRPGRAWTFHLIRIQDRPLAFYVIALFSAGAHVPTLQGCLIAGSAALVIVGAAFVAVAAAGERILLSTTSVLAAAATAALTGMTGNLFHQFLGQVWSVVAAVAFIPVLYWAALRQRSFVAGAGLATLAAALLMSGLYDVRFAAVSVAAALAALIWARQGQDWRTTLVGLGASALAPALASLLAGTWAADLAKLRSPHLRLWPATDLSFSAFAAQSGLWPRAAGPWIEYLAPVVAFLAIAAQAGGLLERGSRAPVRRFLRGYAFLLSLGTVAMICGLAAAGNNWAAHKAIYIALPALCLGIVLSLGSLEARRSRVWRAAGGTLLFLSVCGPAAAAYRTARTVIDDPGRFGVVTRAGLLQAAKRLARARAEVVWFDGSMLDYVLFFSVSEDRWRMIAPFTVWQSGGAMYLGFTDRWTPDVAPETTPPFEQKARRLWFEEASRRLYARAVSHADVQGAQRIVRVYPEVASGEAASDARCAGGWCTAPLSAADLAEKATASLELPR